MTVEEFWTATITEIRQTLESHERCLKRQMQQQAVMDYRHACLVAASFGGKSPPLHEVYPWLFDPPSGQQDWRVAKERLLQYAQAHNRKREVSRHDGR